MSESAQATVEAAILLPCFLTLLLFALQPICVLYTRSVMENAAAQAARLMSTATLADEDAYRGFVLRRLAAVPDLEIFHAGGPEAWDIAFDRADASGGIVSVGIEGSVSPLPVLGAFVRPFGELNSSGDITVSVEVRYEGRPGWLEGSYSEWSDAWG